MVIKVSKYQALLEQQLLALREVVTPATRILAAGKAKDIHSSTLKLFEKYLGRPAPRSPGRRRASFTASRRPSALP